MMKKGDFIWALALIVWVIVSAFLSIALGLLLAIAKKDKATEGEAIETTAL
ncbi:hypothetical protein ACPWSR_13365 [Alloiococcus sp. CFN-8]|uniref:hypothetical protein n=1 Tax=Alloiococcus sp. CFN-8 TaxID=3416081 RepID=UPI003CF8B295